MKRISIIFGLILVLAGCEKEEVTPVPEIPVEKSGDVDASVAPHDESAAVERVDAAADPELSVDAIPAPESPPELSPDIMAALCEGADNVDADAEFPTCKTCPFAAETRYNTSWKIHYAFEGSFSKKGARELFVSGPGCYDAERNHAAALLRVGGKPKVIQALRSTQADVCKPVEWFGRNAVACHSEYTSRGETRKIVTFFEVLDEKLKALRILDIPVKDSECHFEGIYRRDLVDFRAETTGRGRAAVTDVILEFDAKVGTYKSGAPGDCMAIANGDVEVKTVPEHFTISITAAEGSTITRTFGDADPEPIDVDSTGRPKDPTYDLNRPQ